MNNMKYYNDSLAYDFDMFMPKVAEREDKGNIIKMPQQQAAAKKRRRSAAGMLSQSAFAVMAGLFVLAALCGNIALRLEINEVNSQISDVKKSITELSSEKTQLEVEFQRQISYSNIELEAAQLGMKKMEKNQVVYIRVNDKDAAKTKDGVILLAE